MALGRVVPLSSVCLHIITSSHHHQSAYIYIDHIYIWQTVPKYTYSQSPSSNDCVLISVMAEGRTINYDQGWSEGSAQCPSLCLMFAHLVKTLICRNPQADCTTAKRYIFQANNLFLFGGGIFMCCRSLRIVLISAGYSQVGDCSGVGEGRLRDD